LGQASAPISDGGTGTPTTAMAGVVAATPAPANSTLAAVVAAPSDAATSPAARARPRPTRNSVGARVGAAGGAAASSALPPTSPSASRPPVAAAAARASPPAAVGFAAAQPSAARSSRRPHTCACPVPSTSRRPRRSRRLTPLLRLCARCWSRGPRPPSGRHPSARRRPTVRLSGDVARRLPPLAARHARCPHACGWDCRRRRRGRARVRRSRSRPRWRRRRWRCRRTAAPASGLRPTASASCAAPPPQHSACPGGRARPLWPASSLRRSRPAALPARAPALLALPRGHAPCRRRRLWRVPRGAAFAARCPPRRRPRRRRPAASLRARCVRSRACLSSPPRVGLVSRAWRPASATRVGMRDDPMANAGAGVGAVHTTTASASAGAGRHPASAGERSRVVKRRGLSAMRAALRRGVMRSRRRHPGVMRRLGRLRRVAALVVALRPPRQHLLVRRPEAPRPQRPWRLVPIPAPSWVALLCFPTGYGRRGASPTSRAPTCLGSSRRR